MKHSKAGWFSGAVVFTYFGFILVGRSLLRSAAGLKGAHPARRAERRRIKLRTDAVAAWAWERPGVARANGTAPGVEWPGARDDSAEFGESPAFIAEPANPVTGAALVATFDAGIEAWRQSALRPTAGTARPPLVPPSAGPASPLEVPPEFRGYGQTGQRGAHILEAAVSVAIVAVCFLAAASGSAFAQSLRGDWTPAADGASHLEADYSPDSPALRIPKLNPGSIDAAVADEGSFDARPARDTAPQGRPPAVAASSTFVVATPPPATPAQPAAGSSDPGSGASPTTGSAATSTPAPVRAPALFPTAVATGTAGATPGPDQSPGPTSPTPDSATTPVPGATPNPTAGSGTPTSAPTTGATQGPSPTSAPTSAATAAPTSGATPAPTNTPEPTAVPTSGATVAPTPTSVPTPVPSPTPVPTPTLAPIPTSVPTLIATLVPTFVPTLALPPTRTPTPTPRPTTAVPTPTPSGGLLCTLLPILCPH